MTRELSEQSTNPVIVVVGGAGGMGRHAVRALTQLCTDIRIVVADLNAEAAQTLAAEVGEHASGFMLDATDEAAMAELFATATVVVNTMGPFARYGTPILRAALENGCDYLDIDDDWQSTVEALQFDDYARSHGRTAIIGLGASPGTTNVCARIAADRLDRVDDLFTGWSLASAVIEPEPDFPVQGSAAAAKHWLHQCSGMIRAWDNHAQADLTPLQQVHITFPGVGETSGYTMGHPEAITLPRAYPTLRTSVNLQCGPRDLFTELQGVLDSVRSGHLSPEQAAALVDSQNRDHFVPDEASLPDIWALALGAKNGVPTSVAVYPTVELPGKMGGHTGIPLAIGVALLLSGKTVGAGIHAPESAFEPEDFFDLYSRFAIGTRQRRRAFAVIENYPGSECSAPEMSGRS